MLLQSRFEFDVFPSIYFCRRFEVERSIEWSVSVTSGPATLRGPCTASPPFLEVSKSDVAGCGAVVALPPPRRPARGGVVGGTRAGSSSSTHSVFTARPSFFFPSLTQIFFFFIVCVSYNFRRISLKGFSNPVPFSLSIRSLVFFSRSLSSVGRSFQITRSACRPSLPLWRRLRNHSGLTLLQENFVEPY